LPGCFLGHVNAFAEKACAKGLSADWRGNGKPTWTTDNITIFDSMFSSMFALKAKMDDQVAVRLRCGRTPVHMRLANALLQPVDAV
jgi:hypothetical protein